MAALRTLWDIEDASFRAMVEPALIRHGRRSSGPGDAAPCSGAGGVLGRADEVRTVSEAIRRAETDVWPWLRQLLRGGGVYGWSVLEGARCRSAQHLVEGVGDPAVGEHLDRMLEIVRVETPRLIAWRSVEPIEILGHQVDALGLVYRLCPHGPDWTRLTVSLELAAARLTPLVRAHLLDAVELVLAGPQVAAIRRLAEAHRDPALPTRNGQVHQVIPLESA